MPKYPAKRGKGKRRRAIPMNEDAVSPDELPSQSGGVNAEPMAGQSVQTSSSGSAGFLKQSSVVQNSDRVEIGGGQLVSLSTSGPVSQNLVTNNYYAHEVVNRLPVASTSNLVESGFTQMTQSPGVSNRGPCTNPQGSNIYIKHMLQQQRGFPLWIPEPSQCASAPIWYQQEGVWIGDVIEITRDGQCSHLFNICLPADHPRNYKGVPDGFIAFPALIYEDANHARVFKPFSHIFTHGVWKDKPCCSTSDSRLSFRANTSEGAILALPDGALTRDLTGREKQLRAYLHTHLKSWYYFYNVVRGRDLKNGDIRVVIGYDKASSYGLAALHDMSYTGVTERSLCLQAERQDREVPVFSWHFTGSVTARAGPDDQDLAALRGTERDPPLDSAYSNNCIFVRTENPKLADAESAALFHELGAPYLCEGSSQSPQGYGHSASQLGRHGTSSEGSSSSGLPNGDSSIGERSSLSHSDSDNLSEISDSSVPDTYPASTIRFLPESLLSSDSGWKQVYHPSTRLNKALQRMAPNAKTICSRDQDWCALLQNGITLERLETISDKDLVNILESMCGLLLAEEDGYACLQPRESSLAPQSTHHASNSKLQTQVVQQSENAPPSPLSRSSPPRRTLTTSETEETSSEGQGAALVIGIDNGNLARPPTQNTDYGKSLANVSVPRKTWKIRVKDLIGGMAMRGKTFGALDMAADSNVRANDPASPVPVFMHPIGAASSNQHHGYEGEGSAMSDAYTDIDSSAYNDGEAPGLSPRTTAIDRASMATVGNLGSMHPTRPASFDHDRPAYSAREIRRETFYPDGFAEPLSRGASSYESSTTTSLTSLSGEMSPSSQQIGTSSNTSVRPSRNRDDDGIKIQILELLIRSSNYDEAVRRIGTLCEPQQMVIFHTAKLKAVRSPTPRPIAPGHGLSGRRCLLCSETIWESEGLFNHYKAHLDLIEFECPICTARLMTHDEMIKHWNGEIGTCEYKPLKHKHHR